MRSAQETLPRGELAVASELESGPFPARAQRWPIGWNSALLFDLLPEPHFGWTLARVALRSLCGRQVRHRSAPPRPGRRTRHATDRQSSTAPSTKHADATTAGS